MIDDQEGMDERVAGWTEIACAMSVEIPRATLNLPKEAGQSLLHLSCERCLRHRQKYSINKFNRCFEMNALLQSRHRIHYDTCIVLAAAVLKRPINIKKNQGF